MLNFNIPIFLRECHGLQRLNIPVRLGVPLPKGLLSETQKICVINHLGQFIPSQTRSLSLWPDHSIKWLLLDISVTLQAHEEVVFTIMLESDRKEGTALNQLTLEWQENLEDFIVNTGAAVFTIPKKIFTPFSSIKLSTVEILSSKTSSIRLLDKKNNQYIPIVERWCIEESGPLRVTLLADGYFLTKSRKPILSFRARLIFFVNLPTICVELQIKNLQAALHPGGLWDLGDPGSFFFNDLSIRLRPSGVIQQLKWYTEIPNQIYSINSIDDATKWVLYQDSSGGENWNSNNHTDCFGKLSVSFRGYHIDQYYDGQSERLAEGNRATPGVYLVTDLGWIAATVQDFWQNFPKALGWQDRVLSIGLFPSENKNGFELQGGEQKRHTVLLEFGLSQHESVMPMLQNPIHTWVDPIWVEQAKVIPYFVAKNNYLDSRYTQYINHIIEGQNSFFNKRELIDEYGWRNFGDLYADHEAVNHLGSNPLISHYNNQYDFIYGAAIHFLRTGNPYWRRLLDESACHTLDIDIYHTDQDKAAYNHGLFWHTDHYKDVATCTHRTYSWKNSDKGGYGGGPSNEHNYTSGLLYYYYLTGDLEAAAAVLELAGWVLGMDDGSQNLLGLIDDGPTGSASQTVSTLYHKPGRGAGNSINALLDAYQLSNDRCYLIKAEALIQRCIHPKDDIVALKLDEPECHWSYLVFLQILGKYLDLKIELEELDYYFYYARDSFLHYADWMLYNEVPYKDILHKVEIPTETWSAQDIRKCHIFYMAAKYGQPDRKIKFTEKASFFFERCLSDLLSFNTAFLTRPLVILSVYGYIQDYFDKYRLESKNFYTHRYNFGDPIVFFPQQARVRNIFKKKLYMSASELKRLFSTKGYELRNKFFKRT